MTYDDLMKDPSVLIGKTIDREDTRVIIKEKHGEVWAEIPFDAIDEAKKGWADITNVKFAASMQRPDKQFRQHLDLGGGQVGTTGWVR